MRIEFVKERMQIRKGKVSKEESKRLKTEQKKGRNKKKI